MKNAIKFTKKGHIKIKAGYNYQEGFLVVHIEDSGAGIAVEDMHKLFTRFGKL